MVSTFNFVQGFHPSNRGHYIPDIVSDYMILNIGDNTVDGRNPGPPGNKRNPEITEIMDELRTSSCLPDFFHQQYHPLQIIRANFLSFVAQMWDFGGSDNKVFLRKNKATIRRSLKKTFPLQLHWVGRIYHPNRSYEIDRPSLSQSYQVSGSSLLACTKE